VIRAEHKLDGEVRLGPEVCGLFAEKEEGNRRKEKSKGEMPPGDLITGIELTD